MHLSEICTKISLLTGVSESETKKVVKGIIDLSILEDKSPFFNYIEDDMIPLDYKKNKVKQRINSKINSIIVSLRKKIIESGVEVL